MITISFFEYQNHLFSGLFDQKEKMKDLSENEMPELIEITLLNSAPETIYE